MINKKFGIAALAALMGLGLAACGEPIEEIKQNDDPYTVEPLDIHLIGSIIRGGDWTPANASDADKFKKAENVSPEVWTINLTVTQEQIDKWAGVKIHAGKTWDTQWGAEDVDWKHSSGYDSTKKNTSEYFVDQNPDVDQGTSNRDNIVFSKPGTYKFDFHRFYTTESQYNAPIVITKLAA